MANLSMIDDLKNFRLVIEYNIQWGDMDAANHVNNVNYLRWCESARIAYFDKMDMDLSFSRGVGPILGYQDCKYIFPLTYPDTALIGCRTESILADRFIMECKIFSQKYERLCAISKQSIIPYDYEALKKSVLPLEWKSAIDSLENT